MKIEMYTLTLTHEMICEDGTRIKIEQPISVRQCIVNDPYMSGPVCLDHMFHEMKEYVITHMDSERNDNEAD